jgi:hypothetical protein
MRPSPLAGLIMAHRFIEQRVVYLGPEDLVGEFDLTDLLII